MTTRADAGERFVETGRLAGDGTRLVELDALRGLAIALVVAFHYLGAKVADHPVWWVGRLAEATSAGWLGVDLFFVLSGFLIGSILLEHRDAPNLLSVFYVRRAARLLPIYLLVVATYIAAATTIPAGASPALDWLIGAHGPRPPSWSYLLYVQNIYQASLHSWGGHWLAPTWSLAVEEQFYLLAPILICTLPRERLPLWIGVLIAASFGYRALTCFVSGNWFDSYISLPSRADSLLIGVGGALAVTEPSIRRWLARSNSVLMAGLWLTIGLYAYVTFAAVSISSFGMVLVGRTLVAVLSLNLIFVALFTDGWVRRVVLRNPALIQLGGLSYAVYLLHQLCYGLVGWAAGSSWLGVGTFADVVLAAAALVVTLGAAKVSAVWLERPFIALGARQRYDAPRAAVAA